MCSNENWRSTVMPRPRSRVCLQSGLKLDLNRLARKGYIRFGANIGIGGITSSDSYWGEVASGFITADMIHPDNAWFEISIGALESGSLWFLGRATSEAASGSSSARRHIDLR